MSMGQLFCRNIKQISSFHKNLTQRRLTGSWVLEKTNLWQSYSVVPVTYIQQKKWSFPLRIFIKNYYQIRSFLRIWSDIQKKSLIQNFIFWTATTSQNIFTTTKYHPTPAKIYLPPPTNIQKMDYHPTKTKIYSSITSCWHCFNSFFFFKIQYSFPWRRFCVIKFFKFKISTTFYDI